MKSILSLLMFALVMVSCGTDSRHFKIDGRLLHLNQGEFYVYSPDGNMRGMDTIKVQAGRFTYDVECTRPTTLMIVFPNFTEQPVFAQPGKSVDLRGDASHLKEMTVKGTKDNELMNSFREQIASASPPEAVKYARQFIADNPESPVSVYLVRRYFVAVDKPDYAAATAMLKKLQASQPKNASIGRLIAGMAGKNSLDVGAAVPRFTAYGIDGRPVTNATLMQKPTTVVVVWASWNFASTNMLRQVCQKQRDSGGRFGVVGICLDPSPAQCRRTLASSDLGSVPTVCDGKTVDGEAFNRLGLSSLPDNLLISNGRVVAKSLSLQDLMSKLQQ